MTTKPEYNWSPRTRCGRGGLPSPDRADAVVGSAAPLVGLGFSGAVTADRLAGMRFGGFSGSRTLFDCEPVIFLSDRDKPDWDWERLEEEDLTFTEQPRSYAIGTQRTSSWNQ